MNSSKDDILDVNEFTFLGSFEQQLDEILRRVRLTRAEVERLNFLLDDLERIFSRNWPGSHIHPFGSIVTGLGIKTSDIDCYVELPADFPHPNPVKRARTLLYYENKHEYTDMICINTAKVPLLKFVHAPSGCQCDLNFSSPQGVYNSKLIAFLLNMDQRALRLAILVKYWSKVYKLTGTNLVPNYALTMMVIFYLQVKSILPSVEKLQENVNAYYVESWNTAFNKDFVFECSNNENLFALLGGFFTYYRNFDFAQDVISPYLGCTVKKEHLKNVDSLHSYDVYKYNLCHKFCQPIKLDSPMCVQDPFDHSRNCSGAVFYKLFDRLRNFFDISSKRFRDHSSEQYLRALFNLAIPAQPPATKKRKNAGSSQKQEIRPDLQRAEFKCKPKGREIMKNRAKRAKELFLQYQRERLENKNQQDII